MEDYNLYIDTYDTRGKLILNRDEARSLELKLNVSSKGREWSDIGQHLFDYHSTYKCFSIKVNEEQMIFLKKLDAIASWEKVKELKL